MAFLRTALFALLLCLSAPAAVPAGQPAPASEAETGVGEAPQQSMEEAMALLQKATDEYADELLKKPPEGMTEGDVALVFGNFHALGVLGAPDDAKARHYLELAAEKGMGDAYVALGALTLDADGSTPEDVAKAITYYEAAVDAGSVDGMRVLGRLYLDGESGVQKDTAKGEKYLLQAARNGDEYALDRFADKFEEAAAWEKANPGKKADFPASRGAAVDQTLADKRRDWNERMARNVNTVYRGLEKVLFQAMGMDYDAMAERRRMEGEFAAAFDRVALETVESRPDARDRGETAFAIGAIYSFGMAGSVNLDQAEKFYAIAAENGVDEGWAAMAELYAGGIPDPNFLGRENIAKALEYYQKAVDLGAPRAMFALGELYREGRQNLAPDPDKSLEYFKRAAEYGDEDAVAELDKIIAELPEAERAAKGLPAAAKDLVDPKKAEANGKKTAAMQSAFERTESLLREGLDRELEKLTGAHVHGPDCGHDLEADGAKDTEE